MAKLKIIAEAATPAAQNQKRGKLFEALMADVMRSFGYKIDRIPSVNYAGMEIDIEGQHIASGLPLYAECKCYDSEVDSPKLTAFFGKYMAKWMKESRCHGLFIAIPGVNSHAKAFYNENCASATNHTLRLYEEDAVLQTLITSGKLADPKRFGDSVPTTRGRAGEWNVLVTEHGLVVVQWVIRVGSVVPTEITLFDEIGRPITDRTSIDRILDLDPELRGFDYLTLGRPEPLVAAVISQPEETIVEVKGGSECFEYQFPASPEHFIGRTEVLAEVEEFERKLLARETSTRGLLFEANSGWGKSSCVLACADALRKRGHFAIVIDSRSASSAQFILRAVEHTSARILQWVQIPASLPEISGFEGAANHLAEIATRLRDRGKLVFVFLDQFENLFFLPEAFRRIRDLFLKISTAEANVAFGFCWKTDLVGLTNEFPYQLRDSIRALSRLISLSKFSETETNTLLDRLSAEIRSKLREDLRFFLSEFSQGYPWLLKKLCAHVKSQRQAGVSQADIANGLLNVEQLFEEDLNGLSPEEEESLRWLAKLSPVSVSELGDHLKPAVLQSLIDRRLVVRIGPKLDIYWDIFRDYLNTGKVPAQEQYLPRLGPRSIYRACRSLSEIGRPVRTDELATLLKLSAQSVYNVVHEMRTLGLGKIANDKIEIQLPFVDDKEFMRTFSTHLAEKLKRNRLVQTLLDSLAVEERLSLEQAANLLKNKCPYISASQKTWENYADTFCEWLDAGNLAVYDKRHRALSPHLPGRPAGERPFSPARKRGGVSTLQVHYTPVETLTLALAEFLRTRKFAWPDMKPSTREKALYTLEDFGLITREPALKLTKELNRFLEGGNTARILGEAALQLPSFATFLKILKERQNAKCSLLDLGRDLRSRMSLDWSDGTAQTAAKIHLDWARHTGMAPGIFSEPLRRTKNPDDSSQVRLF